MFKQYPEVITPHIVPKLVGLFPDRNFYVLPGKMAFQYAAHYSRLMYLKAAFFVYVAVKSKFLLHGLPVIVVLMVREIRFVIFFPIAIITTSVKPSFAVGAVFGRFGFETTFRAIF